MKKTLIALALLALTPCVVRADDWIQFRGPGGSGVSPETNLPTRWSKDDGLRWKVALPGRGLSCPVIAKGRVYVTCSSSYRESRLHVLCFDEATGKQLWERQFTSTGNTSCHPMTCMAAPTPVTDGDAVYCLWATGDLAALSRDGELLWYRSLVGDYPKVTNQVGMAASPVLAGSTLILPLDNAGDSFIAGVDVKTGKNRWKIDRAKEINWMSPVVAPSDNKEVVLIHSRSEAAALDPMTGKPVWTWAGEGSISTIPSAAFGDGLFYVPGDELAALKPQGPGKAPAVLWKTGKLRGGYPSPVYHQGRLYGLGGGSFNCVNSKDGEQLWGQRITDKVNASPIIADGKAYVVNEKGVTAVIKLGDKPEVLARNDLGGPDKGDLILATPSIANGAIYIRSDKMLYCVGAKK